MIEINHCWDYKCIFKKADSTKQLEQNFVIGSQNIDTLLINWSCKKNETMIMLMDWQILKNEAMIMLIDWDKKNEAMIMLMDWQIQK